MEEEITIQKSPVEQILDMVFVIIEGREEFDTPTIQRLKQLATSGDLTKPARVTEAIKAESEGTS